MTACPEVGGPAVCRVPAPHPGGHLFMTDPVWERAHNVLEAIWAGRAYAATQRCLQAVGGVEREAS